ncbi:MAG: TrmH family RNA methyltransferase [Planctomycetota bacterium]
MPIVRCPNPGCRHEFDLIETKLGKTIRCPGCKQHITARTLTVWETMELQQAKLARTDATVAANRLPLIGVVDDVRSLFNVGSIFRTADGAGVREIVLSGITGVPKSDDVKIRKTALGAELAVPFRYFASIVDALETLKREGCLIVALEADADGARPIFDWVDSELPSVSQPVALLVGNEVEGISAEARPFCDVFLALPMRGIKTSLNVSVAFGIGIYVIAEALASVNRH